MNNLQKLIVSILEMESLTGYDITKIVGDYTGHTHQQVYRELKAMAKVGIVSFEVVEQEDKPNKKVYSLNSEKLDEGWCKFKATDFSKTEGSFFSACVSIGNDNFCKQYIEHMRKAEEEFINNIGAAL